MKTPVLFTACALAAATITGSAFAQGQNGVEHTPVSCIRAGELPLLQVTTSAEGELRGYFRRTNTTDWCSVEGTNKGPLSHVVLPKFEAGDEIEYFFVLIKGSRVEGRSSRIYRVRVTADCEAAWARHLIRLSMNCGEESQGVPSAIAAGIQSGELRRGNPPFASPDTPNN